MRVLVGMSGGVDSSVVAALLTSEGHEVIGVTFRIGANAPENGCCSARTVCDAQEVAKTLGIKHFVSHVESDFQATVIQPFLRDYQNGRTPNPCISCNQHIKFPWMFKLMRELNLDACATGHYARNEGCLSRGLDKQKDQSYVLWTLSRAELCHLKFPLGDKTKDEVRSLARCFNLSVAEKPESMDICFAQDCKGFLSDAIEENPGEIVDTHGTVLGRHKGLWAYTVGQRRGLSVSAGAPLYVHRKDPKENRLVVGSEYPMISSLLLGDTNLLEQVRDCEVQMSSHGRTCPATLTETENGILVNFKFGARTVAPGQSAVFYEGPRVLGGGIVEETYGPE